MSYNVDFKKFARQVNAGNSGYLNQMPTTQLQQGDPNYWQSMADFMRPYANTSDNTANTFFNLPQVGQTNQAGESSHSYANTNLNNVLQQRTNAVNPNIQATWQQLQANPAVALNLSRGNGLAKPYLEQLFGKGLASQLDPYLSKPDVQNQINWQAIMGAEDPAAALTAATRSAALQSGNYTPRLDAQGNIAGLGFASDPAKWAGVFNPSDIESMNATYQGLGGTRTLDPHWQQSMMAARPVNAQGQQIGEIGDGMQYLYGDAASAQATRDSYAVPGFGGAPLQGNETNGMVTLANGTRVHASTLPKPDMSQQWMTPKQNMAAQRNEFNPATNTYVSGYDPNPDRTFSKTPTFGNKNFNPVTGSTTGAQNSVPSAQQLITSPRGTSTAQQFINNGLRRYSSFVNPQQSIL